MPDSNPLAPAERITGGVHVDRRHDSAVVDRSAADAHELGVEIDVDGRDAGDPADLIGHRDRAVVTGHAGHEICLGHRVSLIRLGGIRPTGGKIPIQGIRRQCGQPHSLR